MELTQESLKLLLDYDSETGIFKWKVQVSRIQIGQIAGYVTNHGYIYIQVNEKTYKAHRLAWLYVYGEFPSENIDHINRDKLDNKISNLRLATHSQNKANTTKHKDNKSGYKGVNWQKKDKKWRARVQYQNNRIDLGLFKTKEEAALAYNKKAKELYGEFAFLNTIKPSVNSL